MDNLISSRSESEEPRTVSVYAVHTDVIRNMDWVPVYKRMPARMKRAERYRFERDRLLCVGGGLLLLNTVGIQDESELKYGDCGRAFAPGYPGFNLSHSGEYCLLAVGDAEIGADIEMLDRANLSVAQFSHKGTEFYSNVGIPPG